MKDATIALHHGFKSDPTTKAVAARRATKATTLWWEVTQAARIATGRLRAAGASRHLACPEPLVSRTRERGAGAGNRMPNCSPGVFIPSVVFFSCPYILTTRSSVRWRALRPLLPMSEHQTPMIGDTAEVLPTAEHMDPPDTGRHARGGVCFFFWYLTRMMPPALASCQDI